MKWPVLFLALIFGPASAAINNPGTGGGIEAGSNINNPSTSGCSQATTFLARTSGLSGTETTAYTNLICGLATDGNLSSLDALYILATNTTTTAALNLISTNYSLVSHNSPTFLADHGYTGNGTNAWLDTQFNPSTAGGNFSQNSAMLGVYDLTSDTTENGPVDIGCQVASTVYNYISPIHTSKGAGLDIELVGSTFAVTGAATNSQGQWIVSRTSSANIVGYKNNGVLQGTITDTSQTLTNCSITLLSLNGLGNFSSHQIAAAYIGGGVNSTVAAQIATRINAYMTAVGINVY